MNCSGRYGASLLHKRFIFCAVIFLTFLTEANVSASACRSKNQLIVLQGQQLPGAIGTSINQLVVKRWDGKYFQTIVSQIDQKDQQNRYQLSIDDTVFDKNDELVFLRRQSGKRYEGYQANGNILAEIQVPLAESDSGSWMYVFRSSNSDFLRDVSLVEYDADKDRIQTDVYQAGFSQGQPFLINDFRWRDPASNDYSEDLVDTMKIRHQGRLFGLWSFRRSQQDYSSKLVAVKQGSLRIIRRTENRVRVLWGLKSPVIFIDYVMMPNGFTMDTLINLPFRIGAIFKDLETLTTVDWSKQILPLQVSGFDVSSGEKFIIDGAMSFTESQLNRQQGDGFQLSSNYGEMHVALSIPPDLPIQSWLSYIDDSSLIDLPEFDPGQFGNIGFRTTGWGNVGSGLSYVDFTVCMASE